MKKQTSVRIKILTALLAVLAATSLTLLVPPLQRRDVFFVFDDDRLQLA